MTDLHTAIASHVDRFVAEIAQLARSAALDSLSKALDAPSASRTKVAKNGARAPGEKRSPAELDKATERLAAHVKAYPGQRIETIKKALGIPTNDLAIPIKRLITSGVIVAKGQKRATTYHLKPKK